MKYYLLLPLFLLFICCKEKQQPEIIEKPLQIGLISEKAMVVSAREEASRIGICILQKGGNAFDAMIATEMALAVVHPYAGNLGGGGFMVYRTQYGELGSFDYREKAPLSAEKDMYLDEEGNYIEDKSKKGGLAVGIPGTIAGIFAIHEKLGSLPMEEILQPVIELATKGFKVTEMQAQRLEKHRELFREVNQETSIFTDTILAGSTFKNLALAATLQRIAMGGRAEFYEGETGEKLVTFLQAKGSNITLDDLVAYEAIWREPVVFNYKELKIISMAPPSSGGICLGQIMGMIEPYPIADYGYHDIKTIQLLVEAERRAFADRSRYLGDPDFIEIPIDTLLSKTYLKKRMNSFSFETATPSEEITPGKISGYESTETTHYSIVDQFGNAVSASTTLNDGYGSKLYAGELGFFLNNEMDDFSVKPGEPNLYGLIGGKANAIVPQKRMLSSMTPTIVEKNGTLYMVLGSPGGSRIITSVLQTLLNVYEFNMPAQEAVNIPRFHHQWLPDIVYFETGHFEKSLLKELQKKGYEIDENKIPVIGTVDAILVLPDGRLEGGADRRMDDKAVGW